MQNAIYQEITDQIISEMEKGAAPWVKPWSVESQANKNIVSGKEYQGVNRLILGMSGFTSNAWGSFKQWQDLGGNVKKGEKGTKIVFYKPISKETINQQGETEKSAYACLKTYFVFNADQVEGIEMDLTSVSPWFNERRHPNIEEHQLIAEMIINKYKL